MGFSTNLPNCKLLFTSLLVSFGSTFHFGYQLLIPNPAESAFLHFMNSSMHSMGMNPSHGTVEVNNSTKLKRPVHYWGVDAI